MSLKKGNYLVGRAFWLKHSQLGLPFSAKLDREGGQVWTLTVPQTRMIPSQPKSSSFPGHFWNHGPQSKGLKWSIHRDRTEDISTTIQDLKISASTPCRGKRNQALCVYFTCSLFASLGIKEISLVLHRRTLLVLVFVWWSPSFRLTRYSGKLWGSHNTFQPTVLCFTSVSTWQNEYKIV